MAITTDELERLESNPEFKKFILMLLDRKEKLHDDIVSYELDDKEMHIKLGELRNIKHIVNFTSSQKMLLTTQKNLIKK